MTDFQNATHATTSARAGGAGAGEILPWRRLLGYAHQVMGLAPESVWRLSVVEWRALTAARHGPIAAPLSPNDFTALMLRFPD